MIRFNPLDNLMEHKKSIVFFLEDVPGHYRSAIHLAEVYKKFDYKVIFAGNPSMKKYCTGNGFDHYSIKKEIIANIEVISDSWRSVVKIFLLNLLLISRKSYYEKFDMEIEKIQEMLKRLQPELVLLDIFCSYYYLVFKSLEQKCILIQTMISTRYDPSIPPLNSLTIPNSFGSSRSIKREWRMYWVRKRIAGKVKRLVFLGNDGLSLFKKFALSKGLRYKEIFDFKGSFFPGVKEIREIVISPKELDFPKRLESINQIYFGMPSNFKRFDPMLGESCEELIEELNRIKTEHSHFVIYCSLGSIPDQHSLRYLYFFRKVVESLSQRDDFFIILAVGRLSHTFFDVPRNVRILNYAPQQEILNYTNVFITHGGLNSVLESLNAGVPMIIYPLNNTWDQNGNAARIFYHGFGLIGDIEADSEKDILRNVYKIVNDKSFKDNINKFNSVVRNNHIKSIETIS